MKTGYIMCTPLLDARVSPDGVSVEKMCRGVPLELPTELAKELQELGKVVIEDVTEPELADEEEAEQNQDPQEKMSTPHTPYTPSRRSKMKKGAPFNK